jgi:hypothetical protein
MLLLGSSRRVAVSVNAGLKYFVKEWAKSLVVIGVIVAILVVVIIVVVGSAIAAGP